MAIYWVQTNEDMNPVRVDLSRSEVNGVIKVLEALADQGELVELSDENSEIIFDNSDDWYSNRRTESYKRESSLSDLLRKQGEDAWGYGKLDLPNWRMRAHFNHAGELLDVDSDNLVTITSEETNLVDKIIQDSEIVDEYRCQVWYYNKKYNAIVVTDKETGISEMFFEKDDLQE